MRNKKTFVRIVSVILAAAMIVSVAASALVYIA